MIWTVGWTDNSPEQEEHRQNGSWEFFDILFRQFQLTPCSALPVWYAVLKVCVIFTVTQGSVRLAE